jgi:DNA-binding LytR/AlgR family response regulator
MYKILIIEDQAIQSKLLASYIKELGNDYGVIETHNGNDAYAKAIENEIDLFFIDVNLINESGIELAKKIRKIEKYKFAWMVFITTHVQFMIEAFKDVHCYDYILKPYDKSVIHSTINNLLDNKVKHIQKSKEDEYSFIDVNGILIKIFHKDIVFIETYQKITKIYTKNDILFVKNLPLNSLLNFLNCKSIIQVHRSYALNIDYIEALSSKSRGAEISFINRDEKAPLGDKYRSHILESCPFL